MTDDPRKYDHCGCGGGCCQTLSYLSSIWRFLYESGPEKVGESTFNFACDMLDEAGK